MADDTLYRAIFDRTGEEDLTVSTTVLALAVPAVLEHTGLRGRAVIQARTNNVLFSLNGVDPTAATLSTGQVLPADSSLVLYGREMVQVRFIRATGTDGAIHIRYEKLLSDSD